MRKSMRRRCCSAAGRSAARSTSASAQPLYAQNLWMVRPPLRGRSLSVALRAKRRTESPTRCSLRRSSTRARQLRSESRIERGVPVIKRRGTRAGISLTANWSVSVVKLRENQIRKYRFCQRMGSLLRSRRARHVRPTASSERTSRKLST
eukprot:Amastigsp_a852946_4.p3 type:complete len:150 gc:universal Amastigsp_a852946_4:824-375(-)